MRALNADDRQGFLSGQTHLNPPALRGKAKHWSPQRKLGYRLPLSVFVKIERPNHLMSVNTMGFVVDTLDVAQFNNHFTVSIGLCAFSALHPGDEGPRVVFIVLNFSRQCCPPVDEKKPHSLLVISACYSVTVLVFC